MTAIFQKGIIILEILIAVAIIGLVFLALAEVGNLALKFNSQLKNNAIASNLTAEAMEATKSVKEESWQALGALSLDTPYHPIKNGSPLKWALSAGAENITSGSIFTRQVVLNRVWRDSNDDIVLSGGVEDPNTRKIIATVSWPERGQNKQVALVAYLTNWKP